MTEAPSPALPRRKRANQRGIALVMVFAAMAVLTVILVEFQDESSADVSSAFTDRDALKAEYAARSGVALSRLLIASEPTIRQSIAMLFMMLGMSKAPQIPVWEFSDRVLGAFNDAEGAQEFTALASVDLSKGKNLGLEGGRFELVIVDEDSKLNVNVAARGDAFSQTRVANELVGLMMGDRYNQMFEQRDRDGQFSDRFSICSALIDWADPDENMWQCDPRATAVAQSTGAEDSFYSMLDVPYRRKNTAYDSLQELHLVRGIGEDFWGTFVDPDPGNPKKRVMTVWGQGAINVNTANPQTLLAIACSAAVPMTPLCVDPMQMQNFLMVWQLIRGFTAGAPMFGSPKDFIAIMKGGGLLGPIFTSLGVQPVQFVSDAEAMKLMTTESKVFSIYSDGIVKGFKRQTRVRIHAVVDFRAAPAPGYGSMYGASPMGSGSAGAIPGQFGAAPPAMPTGMGTTGATSFGATPPAGVDPNSIQGALAPNPAGTLIYFRIE
jgi:general secretion pathway protein K